MLTVQTILHPTDLSVCSQHAFDVACSLARDKGAKLIVVHVAPPPPEPIEEGVVLARSSELKDHLWKQMQRLQAHDVSIDHRLVEGDPALEIQRIALETKTDVIILGTHGRSGLSRLLMGSVAEDIVRSAPCQVVTVKTPLPALPSLRPSAQEVATTGT